MTSLGDDLLAEAVAAEVARFAPSALREAAGRLSGAYRGGAPIPARLSDVERAAYLAVRFPSTFAAARAVLQETAAVQSVLDVGAGPGTASLVASSIFPGARVTQVERDPGWARIAVALGLVGGLEIEHRQQAVSPLGIDKHDVAIAAYALGELARQDHEPVVDALWRATQLALVVIEPGTPRGFEVVQRVRARLVPAGGHAAAPCTHDAPCPMSAADWCHRPVRVQRSQMQRLAKDASLPYEDEKFSYVVIARQAPLRDAVGRIVRRPIRAKGHVHLDLCTEGGLRRDTVARSDEAYRAARDAAWGGLWPPQGD